MEKEGSHLILSKQSCVVFRISTLIGLSTTKEKNHIMLKLQMLEELKRITFILHLMKSLSLLRNTSYCTRIDKINSKKILKIIIMLRLYKQVNWAQLPLIIQMFHKRTNFLQKRD